MEAKKAGNGSEAQGGASGVITRADLIKDIERAEQKRRDAEIEGIYAEIKELMFSDGSRQYTEELKLVCVKQRPKLYEYQIVGYHHWVETFEGDEEQINRIRVVMRNGLFDLDNSRVKAHSIVFPPLPKYDNSKKKKSKQHD
jgi:hypothetical protein